MKRKSSFVVLLMLLLSILLQPVQAQSGRQVWAFYLGFWLGGQSWDWQSSLLTDYPAIGKYDSRDGGVMATQIDQAKSAGIDAFLVSWFGVRNAETSAVLQNALDRSAERGFHTAAVIDVFNGFDRGHLVDTLRRAMQFGGHPAYLRYNGKPVIFFAFQERAGLSTADWLAIRNDVDPGHSSLWIAEGLSGCCLHGGAMDGMYAFNLAWANGGAGRFATERSAVLGRGGSLYIPTIHPGWNENNIAAAQGRTNPTSPRDRAGGQFLTNSFNGAISSGADVVLVVSWNEFLENSHIEPSTAYGTQSLDALRSVAFNWKGGGGAAAAPAAVAAAAPTGRVLESRAMLNVRSGPGLGNTAIGQIYPGTTYAVTGEQGDWYQIAFNGQSGFVYGPYARVSQGAATAPAVQSAGSATSDNWCNPGSPWGDGRCNFPDNPDAQARIWQCGWYKAHSIEFEGC